VSLVDSAPPPASIRRHDHLDPADLWDNSPEYRARVLRLAESTAHAEKALRDTRTETAHLQVDIEVKTAIVEAAAERGDPYAQMLIAGFRRAL
jgi:hypothetical protein